MIMASKVENPAGKSGTPASMQESLKKATTEMLVLFLLRQKSMYVYEMIQEASRLSNGVYAFNTLYFAIYRLQEFGYIYESEKCIIGNRTRVYFAISDAGQAYLQQLIQIYHAYRSCLDGMLALDGKIYPEEA